MKAVFRFQSEGHGPLREGQQGKDLSNCRDALLGLLEGARGQGRVVSPNLAWIVAGFSGFSGGLFFRRQHEKNDILTLAEVGCCCCGVVIRAES